jgi:hypothetical protein
MEMASALSATTAPTASAQYMKYNSKTDTWYSIPLYPSDISHFIVTNRKGSSSSEYIIITQDSLMKFFPTKTCTYKLTDEGYVCIQNPKESSLWSIYVDSEGTYYSYMRFGGGFWYATILELEILEPEL